MNKKTSRIIIKNIVLSPKNYRAIKLLYTIVEWFISRSGGTMIIEWNDCTIKDLKLNTWSNHEFDKYWVRQLVLNKE